MELGAQFFTLREYCKDLTSFAETLKKVADIGYKTVQISGTCAYEADWLREQLDANGLRCVITHYSMDKIRDNPAETAAFHKTFGCHHIGIGCAPNCFAKGDEDMTALRAAIDAAATVFPKEDVLLMYHNHACEWQRGSDGRYYFDALVEDYSPDVLGFTLDTFWAQYAGLDVPTLIRRMKGRVPCVHLKDMAVQVNRSVTAPVGHGNMDFDAILAACADAGATYLLVEQDDCYEDPFVCMKKSYDFLRSRGLY